MTKGLLNARGLHAAWLTAASLLALACNQAELPDASDAPVAAQAALTVTLWSEGLEGSNPNPTSVLTSRFDVVVGSNSAAAADSLRRVNTGAHAGTWNAYYRASSVGMPAGTAGGTPTTLPYANELRKVVDTSLYHNVRMTYWRKLQSLETSTILGQPAIDRWVIRYATVASPGAGDWTEVQVATTNNAVWAQATVENLPASSTLWISFLADFKPRFFSGAWRLDDYASLDDIVLTGDIGCDTDADCSDGLDCTADSCSLTTGDCSNPPIAAATACTDRPTMGGDAAGFCDGAGACVECTDAAQCTDDGDACTSAPVCTSNTCGGAAPVVCDDALFCNGTESCNSATGCEAGTAPTVDDGIACTADACDEGTDSVTHTTNAAACDDSNPCTDDACGALTGCSNTVAFDRACTGGFCDALGACVECNSGAQCANDGNACTAGPVCIGNTCANGPPVICDDGLFCNGTESCDSGSGCQAGTAPTVDDGVACTTDACDEGTDSISHTPSGAACDDSNPCTDDSCDAITGCANTVAVDRACPGGFCDAEGACVECNDASQCPDDGDVCNGAPVCSGNTCSTGSALICDDELFCNGTESCDSVTGCEAGAPPSLDDGLSCTVDECAEGPDPITHTPDDSACDDGNSCTDDGCDSEIGCAHLVAFDSSCDGGFCDELGACVECNDGSQCPDDGDVCNGAPVCSGNTCGNDSPLFCDDGLFCNGAEGCDSVTGCQAGAPPSIDDGLSCTVDECVEGPDPITHTPDDAACDDDNTCTDDGCDPEVGCAHLVAFDSSCAGGFCDELGACVECNDGSQCPDDGDACTDGPACTSNACGDGPPVICDDGLFCNGTDTCDTALGCESGEAPIIDDGVACTADACAEGPEPITHTPSNAACDDGNPCTDDTCDAITDCASTVVVDRACPGGVCDPMGACVECNDASDCTTFSEICTDGVCECPPGGCEIPDCYEIVQKIVPPDLVSEPDRYTGLGAKFGESVAVDGNRMIIGARDDGESGFEQGAAFIYELEGTTWVEQTKLTAADLGAGDEGEWGTSGAQLGFQVDLDGDTAIATAPFEDGINGGLESGSVYIYELSGGTWNPTRLISPDHRNWQYFGVNAAIEGDWLMVQSFGGDPSGSPTFYQGWVYVFHRIAGVWTFTQRIAPSDVNQSIGWAIAIDGTTALISGTSDTHLGFDAALYTVHAYDLVGDQWVETQELLSSVQPGSFFGVSLALDGDMALFGAPFHDDGFTDRGAAFAWVRSGGTWVESQMIHSPAPMADLRFGTAVALSGTTATFGTNPAGGGDETFVYEDVGGWQYRDTLNAASHPTAEFELSAYNAGLSGASVISGAPSAADGSYPVEPGAVYTFYCDAL